MHGLLLCCWRTVRFKGTQYGWKRKLAEQQQQQEHTFAQPPKRMHLSCEGRQLARGVPGRQAHCLQRPLEGHRGLRGSSRTPRHRCHCPAAQQRVRVVQHTGMHCSGCSETHHLRRSGLQGWPPPRQAAASSSAHCQHKSVRGRQQKDETALLSPVVWRRTGVKHTQARLRLSAWLSMTALQVLQTRRVPLACRSPSAPSARAPGQSVSRAQALT